MESKNLKTKQDDLFNLLRNLEVNENDLINFIKKNPETVNQKNKDGVTPLMYALQCKLNINVVKLMINNKTDINQKDEDGSTLLMYALACKLNINVVKLMINNKTNINQKNKDGFTPLKLLSKNYSKENIALILSLINYNNKDVINSIRININDSNSKYFLGNPELNKKDFYEWNLTNYLYWNKRKVNINYLLIFSYK